MLSRLRLQTTRPLIGSVGLMRAKASRFPTTRVRQEQQNSSAFVPLPFIFWRDIISPFTRRNLTYAVFANSLRIYHPTAFLPPFSTFSGLWLRFIKTIYWQMDIALMLEVQYRMLIIPTGWLFLRLPVMSAFHLHLNVSPFWVLIGGRNAVG